MASNGYPHMVFVQPDAGLDKESLAAVSYTHLTLPTNREV